MISYFEAMKQLIGIEVSAMFSFITLTAIGFLRIFKSHFRDLRLDVLVAIFFEKSKLYAYSLIHDIYCLTILQCQQLDYTVSNFIVFNFPIIFLF